MRCARRPPRKAATQRHQLSLGCFASIARSALPQLLQEFKALYPDIQIDVTIRGYEMPALLQKGEVQLALVDETCAEGFEWIPLTRVPLIAVVPPTFRWERERISIGRLLKEPFITCQEQYSEKLLPPDAKRIQVTASDDAAILSMVSCGLGVSILSSLSLAGYEGQVKTIPLEIPVVVRVGVAIKSLRVRSVRPRAPLRQVPQKPLRCFRGELRLIRIRLSPVARPAQTTSAK